MPRRFICLWTIIVLLFPAFLTAGGQTCEKRSERDLVFSAGQDARVLLHFCSPSVIRVEYSFDGQFLKDAPTPAVITNDISDVGIHLEEDARTFDIHTGALRLVVDPDWRDDSMTQAVPSKHENVNLTIRYSRDVKRVWVASPDVDGGVPREVSWSASGVSIKLSVPSLEYWTMVVIE